MAFPAGADLPRDFFGPRKLEQNSLDSLLSVDSLFLPVFSICLILGSDVSVCGLCRILFSFSP
jgi:hypothetical protein